MHLTGYPIFFVILLFCGLFPFLLFFVSLLGHIKHPTAYKYETYESGMKPYGEARIRFDVKFYLYALLFILFDIETIFLFPWAVAYEKVGVFALAGMVIFVGILALGIIYAWRKGALRWQ